MVWVMVFNATCNNISIISWQHFSMKYHEQLNVFYEIVVANHSTILFKERHVQIFLSVILCMLTQHKIWKRLQRMYHLFVLVNFFFFGVFETFSPILINFINCNQNIRKNALVIKFTKLQKLVMEDWLPRWLKIGNETDSTTFFPIPPYDRDDSTSMFT
jgi:hypothetical protein